MHCNDGIISKKQLANEIRYSRNSEQSWSHAAIGRKHKTSNIQWQHFSYLNFQFFELGAEETSPQMCLQRVKTKPPRFPLGEKL